MLTNHYYNLHHQLIQEHKSLWRIKKYYLKDAQNCKKCKEFWKKLLNDKEKNIQAILEILKAHKA